MRRFRMLLAGCALIALTRPAAADPAPDPYGAMVAAIEAGKTDADYGALRHAYAETAGYDPYGMTVRDLITGMRDAFSAGDCKTAGTDAEKIATLQFTEIEAHMVTALCLEKEGDAREANAQHAIILGLMKSILDSGDGLAPATAYQVVTIEEEYAVLNLLDLDMKQQALVQEDGHSYDRFTVAKKDGQGETEIFFAIDPIFASLDRQFRKP